MTYIAHYMERLETYTDVDCCVVTRLIHTPLCAVRALFPDPVLDSRHENPCKRVSESANGKPVECVVEER